jgi:hypothetical protein
MRNRDRLCHLGEPDPAPKQSISDESMVVPLRLLSIAPESLASVISWHDNDDEEKLGDCPTVVIPY